MIYSHLAQLNFRTLIACLALVFGLLGTALPEVAQAQQAPGAASTVNINTADAAALADVLVGVGMSRAQEIVRYRETYGPFATVDELTEVKGVGQATLEKNRARITLE